MRIHLDIDVSFPRFLDIKGCWKRTQAARRERKCRKHFNRLHPLDQRVMRFMGVDPDSKKARGEFEC